ncbi:MAG: hypothetical protein OQK66_09485 [Prosthecochloris sp.]|uniref:Uncharacterized protein n=1 Tax=Prosthecochloris aestuarii (strain DSM 271 / SK 413) TaxID=290512 RepID=B4S6N7_PROA2|nr:MULTISPECIES: hypothetical protein [Prosthecochloris]ACF45792.1 hypothetical protein Paes_0745 [Prosthecochloris aestuarii DSM 271]MCW8799183.1 hypothetical protein [Prosthecochloris sp.]RDD30691.1 hypothetical protein CR161_08225 [Prosthecochloris sp. ZM]
MPGSAVPEADEIMSIFKKEIWTWDRLVALRHQNAHLYNNNRYDKPDPAGEDISHFAENGFFGNGCFCACGFVRIAGIATISQTCRH